MINLYLLFENLYKKLVRKVFNDQRGQKSPSYITLLSATLKETMVEPLIEYAGPKYRSLFHTTAPLDS